MIHATTPMFGYCQPDRIALIVAAGSVFLNAILALILLRDAKHPIAGVILTVVVIAAVLIAFSLLVTAFVV